MTSLPGACQGDGRVMRKSGAGIIKSAARTNNKISDAEDATDSVSWNFLFNVTSCATPRCMGPH